MKNYEKPTVEIVSFNQDMSILTTNTISGTGTITGDKPMSDD